MDELRDEIGKLLDAHPYENVDIKPLIEKRTEGLGVNQQKDVRKKIVEMVRRMKSSKKIDYKDEDLGKLFATSENQFITSSLIITSTDEYEKKKKVATEPVSQNIQQIQNNYGIATQDSETSFLDFQPKIKPPIVQKIEEARHGIITSVGKFIIKHIIVEAIVLILAGLIVAYLVYVLKWNK